MNDPTPTAETRPEAHKPVDYRSFGRFDRKIFLQGFWRAFRGRGLGSGALGDVQTLLGLMERDAAVTDIRWMAYMFATVLKETTHPEARQVRVLDRKHRPVLDKNGQPMTRTVRPWVVTMAPVAEVGHGAGRRYHEPVKVLRLEDGSVRVTEIDGDRFSVSKAGVILPLTPKADLGARDGAPHAQVYD
ncbi:MAG: glycoside hydrolase, partial [Burkholderiales bacterium]|nr:glycoside hydrolase [Burkholderiales bacterium]